MFANLFKPKWQHRNPDVRAAAVTKLRLDQPGQSNILRQLALEDPSSSVRKAALARLEDTQSLVDALQSEKECDNRNLISRRIVVRLSEQPSNSQLINRILELPNERLMELFSA